MSPPPRAAAAPAQIPPAMSTTSARTSWADVPDAEPEPLPPPPAANGLARSSYVPPHLRNRPPAAAAADPAPFEDQQNTGINFDAYEDIPVETSPRGVLPRVATFGENDLGAVLLNDNVCKNRPLVSVAAKEAAAAANPTEDGEAAAAAEQADEVAVHPDWSGLVEDLIATVMGLLDIPDLIRAGAVCTSWRAAHSAVRSVRFPIKDASPCLLYSCAGDDEDTACLYSPGAGTAFKVRLPEPAFRRRYVIGSGHGWIVAADEASNLQALNPLTGAQVDLPPITGLHHVESASDDQGRPAYNLLKCEDGYFPFLYTQRELRIHLYYGVYLSCKPSAGRECIVLLIHKPYGEMSFARVGDNRWTLITENETVPWDNGYFTATYNKKDSLFYVVSTECSIYTLDLNNGTPVARKIIDRTGLLADPTGYAICAPWGDILHVWRYINLRVRDVPVHVPADYANEDIDPLLEGYTFKIQLYKVDIYNEKLVEITNSDLRGHALFLGFNFPILVSTQDFPRLRPNSLYLADDDWEHIGMNMFGTRDVGIWDFETGNLDSLDDVHSTNPWLNWPPPVWITPSLI